MCVCVCHQIKVEALCPTPDDSEEDGMQGEFQLISTTQVDDEFVVSGVIVPCHLYTVRKLKLKLGSYSPANSASKHHLMHLVVLGANPAGLYTPLPDLVSQLQGWLSTAAGHAELRSMSLRASLSLAMSSGALSALLRHAQSVLDVPDGPLGEVEDAAHGVLAFLEKHKEEVKTLAPAPGATPRIVDLVWDNAACNPPTMTIEEEGKLVKNPSTGNGNAVANVGFSKGKVFWEMQLVTDSRNGECSCFGAVFKPVTSTAYQHNNHMFYRSYNAQLYAASGVAQTGTTRTKIHPDDIVRIDLDCDEKTIEYDTAALACVVGLPGTLPREPDATLVACPCATTQAVGERRQPGHRVPRLGQRRGGVPRRQLLLVQPRGAHLALRALVRVHRGGPGRRGGRRCRHRRSRRGVERRGGAADA